VVSGSGSESNPYIIENWTIDASNDTGIWIENTDVYFIIRNCYIFNGTNGSSQYYGAYFYNITNGTIEDNRIANNSYGILFYNSNNNKIVNNTIKDHPYRGFYLSYSNFNEVSFNNISNCTLGGLELYASDNNSISNNDIFNNPLNGLILENSINNLLYKNAFFNNTFNFGIKGISVEFFTHQIFTNNTVNGKPIYYWIDHSDKKIPENAGFVGLVNCSNITVSNLSITSNYNGILISSTLNSKIENNDVFNNTDGIFILNSTGLIVTNNSCYQNDNSGIGVVGSSFNQIINNNCSRNKRIGIGIAESENNTFKNNICNFNKESFGIYIINSDNNTLVNNSCNNNSCGIWIISSNYNKILNSNFNFNYHFGISLAESNNNNISKNDVCSITGGTGKAASITFGFQIYYSNNNTISSNNCSSNLYGILLAMKCHNNSILYNNISFNKKSGLIIDGDSNFGLISKNTFISNNDGLVIINTDSINVSNNSFNSDHIGINIYSSTKCNLTNNKFTQSGIYLNGEIEHWNTHYIPTSNKINEKPLYYLKNQSGNIIPAGAGGVILANCSNIEITDQNLNNGTVGILSGYTNNLSISNTTCDSNNNYGINLYYTNENQIINTTCNSNDNIGIYFHHSNNNTIIRCTSTSNTNEGILSSYSKNTTILNSNCLFNTGGGISIGGGINRIENTTCNKNYNFGIKLSGGSENKILNNRCNYNNGSDHVYGIFIESSNNNLIINNTCNYNKGLFTGYGIRIENSDFNNISKNTCNFHKVGGTGCGIYTSNSNSNSISKNNCSHNNGWGLTIRGKSNEIKENYFYSNDPAIVLSSSENSTLTDNKMYNCGIFINAADLKYWNTHNITTSNTVNGRPVRYFKNKNSGTVPQGAGQIILAKCSNMKIENQTISNGSDGIIIGYSDYIKVLNNTVYGNAKHAIVQSRASYNKLINNTIYNNNGCGIFNTFSDNNLIEQNKIHNNNDSGIHFYRSTRNTIKTNFLNNNSYGIYLLSYSNNNLFYNNYFSNQKNYFKALRISNTWSVSKILQQNIIGGPYLGGNYWSDYNGTDTDGDGLGDTQVPFGPGDSRPLCNVNDSTSPSITKSPSIQPYTGDKYNLTVSVSDFSGVDRVYVKFWCDQGKPTNKTMSRISGDNRSGAYSYFVDIPSDGKFINYQFSAKDIFNNWRNTSIIQINIVDNDKPILEDHSTIPVTGEKFKFNVSANDNLNIKSVNVKYWFNDELIDDIPLSKDEEYYSVSIDIPINTKVLKYIFYASDDSNNVAELPMREVNVIDNITPKIIDNSDSKATTGDEFTFDFNITDNIELTAVYLEYWFDSGNHIKLTLPSPFKYAVNVPLDAFKLNAKVSAMDPSGNYDQLNLSLKVIDNDPPEIEVLPTENPNTGEEFLFKWIINENRELKNVTLEYEFSDHIHHNISMEVKDGVYSSKIDIPIDTWIFFYVITAFDDEDFGWVNGHIFINDTIPPKIYDLTLGQPTMGKYFYINATAQDNIEVQLFELEYWFDDESPTKIVFNETHSIMVPNNTKILNYKLIALDSSNNSVTVENSINVKQRTGNVDNVTDIYNDTEKPVIKVDSPDIASTGDLYNITVSVSDNVLVRNIKIEHWILHFISSKWLFIYEGEFSKSIPVPDNATELHYRITATDSSNNTQIYERKISVIDNDKPSFEDRSYEKDGSYVFSITATDNIGISKVTVIYSYDGNKVQNLILTKSGTNYEKYIPILENAISLSYYIIVEDTSGNVIKSTVEEIIFDKDVEPETKTEPESRETENNIWLAMGLVLVLIIIFIALILLYIRSGKNKNNEET
jgi:parallel beta-helix repeat protein